mmetsp:Transcript_22983/g.70379  ORF Transcript_22983/g.70379 Transcript_22983/m.70379 type:complete len:1811 (+) Transcript_22983:138-5570(+)
MLGRVKSVMLAAIVRAQRRSFHSRPPLRSLSRRLGTTLVQAMYPGSPFERCMLALELYSVLIDEWAPPDDVATPPGRADPARDAMVDAATDVSDDPRRSLAYPWTLPEAVQTAHLRTDCTARAPSSGHTAGTSSSFVHAPARASVYAECKRTFHLFGPMAASRLLSLMSSHTFEAVRTAAFELLARFPQGELPGFPSVLVEKQDEASSEGDSSALQWHMHGAANLQEALPHAPRQLSIESLLNGFAIRQLSSARAHETAAAAALVRVAVGRYVVGGECVMRVLSTRSPFYPGSAVSTGGAGGREDERTADHACIPEDAPRRTLDPKGSLSLNRAAETLGSRPSQPSMSMVETQRWYFQLTPLGPTARRPLPPEGAVQNNRVTSQAPALGVSATGVGAERCGGTIVGRAILLLHDLSMLAERCIRGHEHSAARPPSHPAGSQTELHSIIPLQDNGGGGSLHGALAALRAVLSEVESIVGPTGRRRSGIGPAEIDTLRSELPPLLTLAAAATEAALAVLSGPASAAHRAAGDLTTSGVEEAGRDRSATLGPVRHRPATTMGDAGGGSIADWGFLSDGQDANNGHVDCDGEDEDNEADCSAVNVQVMLEGVRIGAGAPVALPRAYVKRGKLVVVRCWLALKEAALLVAAVVRLGLPLPSHRIRGSRAYGCDDGRMARTATGSNWSRGADATALPSSSSPGNLPQLLSTAVVNDAGNSLIGALLRTRHNGAIEMCSEALAELSHRALVSLDADTAALPASWCAKLLEAAIGGGGATTHVRRSAGLPHALLAVLYAEERAAAAGRSSAPSGTPMFTHAVRQLLARAIDDAPMSENSHADQVHGCDANAEESAGGDNNTGRTSTSADPLLLVDSGDSDGRVHALNLLRFLFIDKAFGLPAQPFFASGFKAAFIALGSSRWPVRNSGLLLLASLLSRALRNRRQRDEHAAANGLGIRDFFTRAPELYPFLLACLRRSTAAAVGDNVALKEHLHDADEAIASTAGTTDLFGILCLLGKLVPSPATPHSSTNPTHDLAPFLALVSGCSELANHKLRVVAARAIVPLVPSDGLAAHLLALASSLPSQDASTSTADGLTAGPRKCRGAHNRLHGVLLQMVALLTAARQRAAVRVVTHSPSDDVERPNSALASASLSASEPSQDSTRIGITEMCRGLLSALLPAIWMISLRRQPCAPIRLVFIQVLSEALAGADAFCVASERMTCTDGSDAVPRIVSAVRLAARESLAGSTQGVAADSARLETLNLDFRLRLSGYQEGCEERYEPGLTDPMLIALLRDAQYEARLLGLYHTRALLGLPPCSIDTDDVPVVPRGASGGLAVSVGRHDVGSHLVTAALGKYAMRHTAHNLGATTLPVSTSLSASCNGSTSGARALQVMSWVANSELCNSLYALAQSLVHIVAFDSMRSCVLHAMALLAEAWVALGPAVCYGSGTLDPTQVAIDQRIDMPRANTGAKLTDLLGTLTQALHKRRSSDDAELSAYALHLAACCSSTNLISALFPSSMQRKPESNLVQRFAQGARVDVGAQMHYEATSAGWSHDVLDAIDEASSYSNPEPLRLGAALALSKSSLMVALPCIAADAPKSEISTTPWDGHQLRAWLIALRALEDDSENVRRAMACATSPLLADGSIQLHPSAVVRLAWRRLASTFATSVDVADELMRRIVGVPLRTSSVQRERVRRIIDVNLGAIDDGCHAFYPTGDEIFDELFPREPENTWVEWVEQAAIAAPLLRSMLHVCQTMREPTDESVSKAASLGNATEILQAAGSWRNALGGRRTPIEEGGITMPSRFLWERRAYYVHAALNV